ncbi:MAG: rhodanese-like domain-containing protein [Rhodospirillales bacterium]|jgi:rhodanese-related sulfurtransferase
MTDETPLEIDVAALNKMREDGIAHTVLDVREPQELDICALSDALVIRMAEIPESLDKLPKDGAIIVMCHSGMRSMQVTQWLRMNGYENAQNLAGGIDAWAATFDPEMQRY